MSKKTLALLVAALALVAAGSAAAARHAHHARHARHGGTVVKLRNTALGKVLVTSSGMTLYLYTPDPKGKSVCTGSCAAVWPPLLTKGRPHAGPGARAKLLGTTRRGGRLQVTYAGHPLYVFTGDSKAGQTAGEGYGGIWYVVSASGKKVTSAQSGSGSGGGGGGGGY